MFGNNHSKIKIVIIDRTDNPNIIAATFLTFSGAKTSKFFIFE